MFTDTDTATAPFDIDEDGDNPYITEIPERFLNFSEDEAIEAEAAEAWGAWLELTFNSEGN